MRTLILAAFAAGSLAGFVAGLGFPVIAGGWRHDPPVDYGEMDWLERQQFKRDLRDAIKEADPC